jgi:hypothetical protein
MNELRKLQTAVSAGWVILITMCVSGNSFALEDSKYKQVTPSGFSCSLKLNDDRNRIIGGGTCQKGDFIYTTTAINNWFAGCDFFTIKQVQDSKYKDHFICLYAGEIIVHRD